MRHLNSSLSESEVKYPSIDSPLLPPSSSFSHRERTFCIVSGWATCWKSSLSKKSYCLLESVILHRCFLRARSARCLSIPCFNKAGPSRTRFLPC